MMALRFTSGQFLRTGRWRGFAFPPRNVQRLCISTQTPAKPPHRLARNERFTTHAEVASVSSVFIGTRKLSKEDKHSISGLEKHELFLAALDPLSPSDLTVQSRLKTPTCNPTKILQQAIAAGTASVHVVRLCLEAQYQQVAHVPRTRRRQMAMAQDNIASMVLDYILQGQHLWGPLAMHCTKAQFHLSYYAIIHGIETRLLTLVEADMSGEKVQSMWRGSLLRNVITAYENLDYENNKDSAIRCFLDMLAKRQNAQRKHGEELARNPNVRMPSILYLNMLSSCVKLSDLLTKNESKNTSSKLFDQLIEAYGSPGTFSPGYPRNQIEYDIAGLLLFYPSYPKDTAAVQLLRKFAAGDVNAFPDRITTPKGQKWFKKFLQRTVDVLQANGNTSESDWIKRTFQVLLDPSTGDFDIPTEIEMPGNTYRRRGSHTRETISPEEPIPFPTFT